MDPQTPQSTSPAADGQAASQQVAQQIKNVTNILVTVSANPSVDQLATAIGTTILLNKIGKHATAVFSGEVPSTIEFLKPESTLEKTTDSLQDFIIALDKSKADKLRYKVEDKFVRIYITPYHTSLSEKDLEFSQGDYNVELVLALGVKRRDDLDGAIVAHGQILHDAAVVSINTEAGADLGSVNLNVPDASSLGEIMVDLIDQIKEPNADVLDEQIATAYLTGIVAETERFSNDKTTPKTMSVAAKLMNAGANQQLIATKLEPPEEPPAPAAPVEPTPPVSEPPKAPDSRPGPGTPLKPTYTKAAKPAESHDGAMDVPHESKLEIKLPNPDEEANEDQSPIDRIHIDEEGRLKRIAEAEAEAQAVQAREAEAAQQDSNSQATDSKDETNNHKLLTTSPDSHTEADNPVSDVDQDYDRPSQEANAEANFNHRIQTSVTPSASEPQPNQTPDQTLTDLEKKVHNNQPNDTSSVDYPSTLVDPNKGLPPDETAGSGNSSSAPPVPPPLPPDLTGAGPSIPL